MATNAWKQIEKMKDADKPILDNYPDLAKWLYGCRRARCAFQLPNGSHLVEGWLLGTKLVIFQFYDKKFGYEVYVPIHAATHVGTFEELGKICDLTENDWEK